MKSFVVLLGAILLLSACSSRQPIVYTFTPHAKHIAIYGTYSPKSNEASDISNLAFFIKEAAKIFKEHNIKYFYIENQNIPKVLNNFSSLVLYCYPDNGGYKPSEFGDKNTNLEQKCNSFHALKTDGTTYYNDDNNIVIAMKGSNKLRIDIPLWSVEEVLADQEIQKYIDAAKLESKNITTTFIESPDGSTRYEMSRIYRKEYMHSLF